MGHWYRRLKRLNLKYVLQDPACEFIFDASQTSAEELLALRLRVSSIYAPHRLVRDLKILAAPKRILIVWEDADHPAPSRRLQDGWRGIVLTPANAEQRRRALEMFFMLQLHYRISHPYWASQYGGEIPPFLLDLTKIPATITPAQVVAQQHDIEE